MKITVENTRAKVYTPYNKEFVAKIKLIGGAKWEAAEKCRSIPKEEIETARAYMVDVYGMSDIPDTSEKVNVEVRFNADDYERCEGISLFGRTVIRAFGRDSGARVGEDVTLVSGNISSGGSMKNWETQVSAGTVLRIRNVSRKALEIPHCYDITVTEIGAPEIDREALLAERERLLARIAEIDAQLNA